MLQQDQSLSCGALTISLNTLASLHWLRSSDRIQYKLVTMVFWSLHGVGPPYLSDDLHRLMDILSR